MTPGEFRLRVTYGKTGRLRHLSHLEVVHALERMVRRARLPFAVTQGFNPHMKIAFGPALPVGTAGEREYLDVWLTRFADPGELLGVLRNCSPDDLAPRGAQYVNERTPSLTAALTLALYRVDIEGEELEPDSVQTALERVVSMGELTVESRGKDKVFDLTRAVPKDARVTGSDRGVSVEIPVRMGPEGSLRPELLIRSALASAGISAAALRTTRLDTFIEGDEGVWLRPV